MNLDTKTIKTDYPSIAMNPNESPFDNPPSFHSDDIAPSKPEDAAFHIVPAPMETSVSYGGGTSQGPAAILHASTQLEAYIDGNIPGEAGIYTTPIIKCHSDPKITIERVRDSIGKVLNLGKIPLLLGGEHAVTLGPVLEINSRGIEFGVVQFDAHADLRDSYHGDQYSHACIMKRVADLDIPIFQIGVRSLSAPEAHFRETNKIPHLDADQIAFSGIPETILPTDFPTNIYITFDVDGFDPSLIPSTGTPEPGGLGWYQAIEGLDKVMRGRTVLGADIVELAPVAKMHSSDFITAKLVYKMMDLILKNQ